MSDVARLLDSEFVYATIELPDGSILTGKAVVASVSLSRDVHPLYSFNDAEHVQCFGKSHWDIGLQGVGELELRKEFKKRVEAQTEWMCPYCMVPNDLKKQRCQACGAWRPFALGG